MVNNAGIGAAGGPLDFLTRRTFSMVFDVNVFGMAEVSRVFLPLLKKSQGRLINMTSIAGLIASSMDIAYSASKFAAEGLSDTLRLVRVNIQYIFSVANMVKQFTVGWEKLLVMDLKL